LVCVEGGWDHKADDERFVAWNRMAAGRLAEISMRGNYVNEQGDFGKEIALGAYGERKYSRLAKLKARYDPANLFRLNQNIEPKP
jgi:FAD/FMN-containing dehydrogenase